MKKDDEDDIVVNHNITSKQRKNNQGTPMVQEGTRRKTRISFGLHPDLVLGDFLHPDEVQNTEKKATGTNSAVRHANEGYGALANISDESFFPQGQRPQSKTCIHSGYILNIRHTLNRSTNIYARQVGFSLKQRCSQIYQCMTHL